MKHKIIDDTVYKTKPFYTSTDGKPGEFERGLYYGYEGVVSASAYKHYKVTGAILNLTTVINGKYFARTMEFKQGIPSDRSIAIQAGKFLRDAVAKEASL